MKRFLFAFIFLIACAVPLAAGAADEQPSNIVVPSGEVIRDNFVRVGLNVEINGEVQGDLIVLGQTVVVNGPVAGDVLVAAQSVRINGPVAGNIRVAAGDVRLDASVGKNATIFGNTVELTNRASVGWSAQVFGSTVDMSGVVFGNANAYCATATIRGEIQGNTRIVLGEQGSLRLTADAVIGKDLTYQSSQDVVIDSGASVRGTIRKETPQVHEAQVRSFIGSLASFWRLVSLFGLLVVGLVILSIFPKSSERIAATMRSRPWRALGWGAILLVVAPIVAVILLLTVIGIPLAVIAIVLYAVALYLTKVFVGLMLGTWILGRLRKGKPSPQLWSLILGVVIWTIITMIPYIGWFFDVVGGIWALGAMLLVKKESILQTEKV